MTCKEAAKMIPHVRATFGTANFTRESYTAQEWFDCIGEALEKQVPKKKHKYKGFRCVCGKEVAKNQAYCEYCGQRLE